MRKSTSKKILNIAMLGVVMIVSANVCSAKTGKEVYDKACHICHDPAMSKTLRSVAAHSQEWEPLIIEAIQESSKNKTQACSALTQGKSDTSTLKPTTADVAKLKVDQKSCYLLPYAVAGRTRNGAMMPPKGTCMDCTDADLKSGIEFMLSK